MTDKEIPLAANWKSFTKSPIDWILIAGLLGLTPLLWEQGSNLWSKPHYQYFPIAWGGFVYLVLSRATGLANASGWRNKLGLTLFLLSIIGFSVAVIRFSPWQAHLSLVLLCAGWAFSRLGSTPWTSIIAWISILACTLPMPFDLDLKLIQTLQTIASNGASRLLDLFSVPHLVKGNVLEIEKGTLFVDEACSGVDSLYALVCATLLLLVIRKRSFVQSLLILILVPFWGLGGNMFRITLISYLYQVWDINCIHGWQHTVVGLVIFGLAFLSVVASLNVISELTFPLPNSKEWLNRTFNILMRWPKSTSENSSTKQTALANEPPKTNRFVFPFISVSWIILGLVSLGPFLGIGPWKQRDLGPKPDRGQVESIFSFESLPKTIDSVVLQDINFTFREDNHYMGEFSATWQGLDADRPIMISLDFPFAGHHPLEGCYELTGSTILQTKYIEERTANGIDYFREADLVDQYEQTSYVVYTLFEADGQSLRENSRLMDKLFPSPPASPIYQVQVYTPNQAYPSEQERAKYRTLLLKVKEILLPQIQQLRK